MCWASVDYELWSVGVSVVFVDVEFVVSVEGAECDVVAVFDDVVAGRDDAIGMCWYAVGEETGEAVPVDEVDVG